MTNDTEKTPVGRPKKVTAQEILETLSDKQTYTKDELAGIFDVCTGTIGNRLRELRDDAEPVFFDDSGIFLLDKINSEEDSEKIKKYFSWVLGALKGVIRCGNPTRPLMLESKQWIKKHLTLEERKKLGVYTMQINRMIDYVQMEEDMED